MLESLISNKRLLNYSKNIAKIGLFEFDVLTQQLHWSEGTKRIAEVSSSFEPSLEKAIHFFKKGFNQSKIKKAFLTLIETGEPFNLDLEIITDKGNKKFIWCIGEAENEAGKPLIIHGIVQDITERKKNEKELIDKNSQLKLAQNLAKISYWKWDVINNTFELHNQLYPIVGFDAEEPLGVENFFQSIYPEDKKKVITLANQFLQTKKFKRFTHRAIREDGSLGIFEIDGTIITNENNDVVAMLGASQDITKTIEQSNKLAENINQLNLAEELSGIGRWSINLENQEIHWSNTLYKLYDIAEGTTITYDNFLEKILPEDRELVINQTKNLIKKQQKIRFTHRSLHKDGSVKYLRSIGDSYLNKKGLTIKLVGTTQDITQDVLSKQELEQRNFFLRSAESLNKMGHWFWDIKNQSLKWSDNLYKIFELEIGTPVSFEFYQTFLHEDDKDRVIQKFEEALATGITSPHSYRLKLPSGKIKTIKSVSKVKMDEYGDAIEMLGACQDVSEQVAKQELLIQKNSQLNLAEEMTVVGHWSWKPATNEVFWSENLYKIYERKEGNPITYETYLNYVHPDDKGFVGTKIKEAFETGKFENQVYRIQLANGTIKTIKSIGKVIQDSDGSIIEMLGTCQDITADIAKEKELLLKNELLNSAEQLSKVGYWRMHPKISNYGEWSDNHYRIFGFELGSPTYFERVLAAVIPEDKHILIKTRDNIFIHKNFPEHSYRIELPDGSIKNIEGKGSIKLDESGEIEEIIGTVKDVTQERAAEIKFKDLLASTPDALLIVNESGQIQLSNKEAEKLFGYSQKELQNLHVIKLVAKGYKSKSIGYAKAFFKEPKNTTLTDFDDLHIVNKNGKHIPAQVTLGPFKTENKILVILTIKDISIQKQAEKELLNTNAELKSTSNKLAKQNRQLADFTHITSHNLRSPVSNLNTLLGLYHETEDSAQKEFLFEKFETVIDHLTVTLNTLVDSLKIKNQTEKDLELVFFEDVLLKTKGLLSAEILETEAQIKSNFEVLPNIKYNGIYLESIFLNLISNSIKYRRPNVVPEIEVFITQENNTHLLHFKDNGLGIDLSRHRDKIFGLNKVFHRNPEARGIGLFLTKAQIEAMGGGITVESSVNEGSTFSIDLKVKIDE